MTNPCKHPTSPLSLVLTAAFASVALGASVSASAAAPQDQPHPQKNTVPRGLIHNEDCSNFFMLREAGDMTIGTLNAFVDQYAETQLTHLFLNPNAMRTSFRSAVWDNIWRTDDPEPLIANGRFPGVAANWARNAFRLDQQGLDPYAVWITRSHELGISPWISMRMNDCHENDNPDSYLHSAFWLAHPEYWRGGEGYFARCFNYAIPEVRDYHMALIREYLQRYDLDGLELDWMRECYCFKPGEEEQGRPILTAFMRDVRALANQRAAERGRPIRIAARVPAVPEASFGMGLDGAAWAKEGLVDMLIPTARWATADFDIPIDKWKELLGDAHPRVTLAAGMEIRIQPYPGADATSSTLETLRGFSAAMLERGAGQIYLFNHMSGPNTPLDEYRRQYNEAGQLETVLDKPRRHVVTYHDISPPGKTLPCALPVDLAAAPDAGKASEPAANNAASFSIYIGPPPTTGQVIVRVGLAQSPGLAAAQLAAKANAAECTPIEDHPQPATFCDSVRLIQFTAPLQSMQRGYNTIGVALQKGGPQRIVWLELYIVP